MIIFSLNIMADQMIWIICNVCVNIATVPNKMIHVILLKIMDYAANATGIRLGTHDEMNYLDSEVDNDLRKKKKFW